MLEHFKNMTMFNRIRFCICILLVCVGLCVIAIGGNEVSLLESESLANKAKIAELNQELQTSDATPDEPKVIKRALVSCKDLGEKVASYQNDYQKYDKGGHENERMNISNELDVCFGGVDKNACVEWYNMGSADGEWIWKFETNYSFTATSVPVLWTCRHSDTNELLAYTTGTYNTVSGLFEDVKWQNTSIGQSYIGATQVGTTVYQTTSVEEGDAND